MKNSVIEQITTLRNPNYPKIVWVLIKTNDGIEGIGETSYDPGTVESFILGEASDYLLGKILYCLIYCFHNIVLIQKRKYFIHLREEMLPRVS